MLVSQQKNKRSKVKKGVEICLLRQFRSIAGEKVGIRTKIICIINCYGTKRLL